MVKLRKSQLKAIDRLHNGCVLCGDTGSGKSLTSLGYYYLQQGGSRDFLMGGPYRCMTNPKDLYIITTARKRDTFEWEKELMPFRMVVGDGPKFYPKQKVVVDSWNNISKYVKTTGAFFIFDEQRVVGNGTWSKTFVKIAKTNDWILLSATPGDKWEDYLSIFMANGFYRTKKEFEYEHLVYAKFVKFPKIERYINTDKLEWFRDQILVDIPMDRSTTQHHNDVYVAYDGARYKLIYKKRADPDTLKPFRNASAMCYALRRVVNSDESRGTAVLELVKKHPKVIIFYNFDYELDILRGLDWPEDTKLAEWNGSKHEPIPVESDKWVYLVQYLAGSEGWNCIETDTIIFYSQNYSYRVMKQASGRIDRMNTPYIDLYYYHLKSRSGIDLSISRAIDKKKNFNEKRFLKW